MFDNWSFWCGQQVEAGFSVFLTGCRQVLLEKYPKLTAKPRVMALRQLFFSGIIFARSELNATDARSPVAHLQNRAPSVRAGFLVVTQTGNCMLSNRRLGLFFWSQGMCREALRAQRRLLPARFGLVLSLASWFGFRSPLNGNAGEMSYVSFLFGKERPLNSVPLVGWCCSSISTPEFH